MHAWALLSSPLWNCMFPVNNIPCQTSQSISFSSLKHNKRMYYSLVSRNYAIIMYSLLSYFFRNWLTLVGGTSFYQPWWSWRSPLQCYHCLCKLASKIQGILRLRSDTQLSIDSMNYFLLYSSFTFCDQTDLLCCAVCVGAMNHICPEINSYYYSTGSMTSRNGHHFVKNGNPFFSQKPHTYMYMYMYIFKSYIASIGKGTETLLLWRKSCKTRHQSNIIKRSN